MEHDGMGSRIDVGCEKMLLGPTEKDQGKLWGVGISGVSTDFGSILCVFRLLQQERIHWGFEPGTL